jgi:anti-anti-sigma factor
MAMLASTSERRTPTTRLPRCISFAGTLDAFTAPAALGSIERVMAEDPSELIVDLAGLELIDSVGIRVLATLTKRLNERGGRVVLVNVQGQPKLVLDLLERKLNVVLGR